MQIFQRAGLIRLLLLLEEWKDTKMQYSQISRRKTSRVYPFQIGQRSRNPDIEKERVKSFHSSENSVIVVIHISSDRHSLAVIPLNSGRCNIEIVLIGVMDKNKPNQV